MNHEDRPHPISLLARNQRRITDLRSGAPPSDVYVYDKNHKLLRIVPATFFETLVLDKKRNNKRGLKR